MKKNVKMLFCAVCAALVIVSIDNYRCHKRNARLIRTIHKMSEEADYVKASDCGQACDMQAIELPSYYRAR